MLPDLRPFAVIGLSAGVSLGVASRAWEPGLVARSEARPVPSELQRLDLLDTVLYHVEETYVEPSRIDWERMLGAALTEVEQHVPSVLFGREPGGRLLHVEVGGHRVVHEVAPVTSRAELVAALRLAVEPLALWLDPDEVATERPGDDALREIEFDLVNGMLRTLDPHSALLRPADAGLMEDDNRGAYGGIGVTVHDRGGRLVVTAVNQGEPAAREGILPDDVIERIDGRPAFNIGIDAAMLRLRGPVDTEVVLHVRRKDERTLRPLRLLRETIESAPVVGDVLDGGIAWVRIESFHVSVDRELRDLLAVLQRKAPSGLRGLVLDLRGNPGGYVNQAVEVADLFLTEGDIVSTVDGNGRRRDAETARATGDEPPWPIVVLMSATSASAAEIVAGALQGNERAVVVGEHSFGKGSVQTLEAFPDGSRLKLTISKYLTPGDRSIQSVGIPADVELVPTWFRAEDGDDPAGVELWFREGVSREIDLDRHLEQSWTRVREPSWRLRYVPRPAPDRPETSDEFREPGVGDLPVTFARDLLLAAPAPRRSEMLAAAGPVVEAVARSQDQAISARMATLGIDWRDGPAMPRRGDRSPASIQVAVSPAGALQSGTRQTLTVTLANDGDRPLHRATAVLGEHPVVGGHEFAFGLLRPGESVARSLALDVPNGLSAEDAPLTVSLRDTGEGELDRLHTRIPVREPLRPSYRWSWSLDDRAGDGDGRLDAGEALTLTVALRNVGSGPGVAPTVRLRAPEASVMGLVDGILPVGSCQGVDCVPTLAAGATAEVRAGLFTDASAGDAAAADFELLVEDVGAWDRAALTALPGFPPEWRTPVTVRVGDPLPTGREVGPPQISVSRAPRVREAIGRVTLSGVATDDDGVSRVLVFVGSDKVFHQGPGASGPVASVPFTADAALVEGRNTLTVVAIDADGLVAVQSAVSWADAGPLARAVP